MPDNYRQDAFLKYHNLKQKELSVEDYVAEFECLVMRCDIVEQEEQTIARFLGGLRYDICNVVQLQPYWTYDDVCELALKVEKQQIWVVFDFHLMVVISTEGARQPLSPHLYKKSYSKNLLHLKQEVLE